MGRGGETANKNKDERTERMTERDLVAAYCMENPLQFTRHMFRSVTGNRFIVGEHHRLICDKVADVLQGKTKRLIINIAPRYGKTVIISHHFIAMGLAANPAAKFLHLSFSADLAQENSVTIKDIVKSDEYRRLFPHVVVKDGSDTKSRWDTTAGGGVYATSTLGQITGFGAGVVRGEGEPYRFGGAIVIDDPIKPEDALSDNVRESVNRRFETTIRSRVNDRETPIIIIMQRLHEHDLCGYLQELEPGEWEVLSLPCITEEGKALWEFKHSVEELEKLREVNPFVFDTQYMQNPKPLEGLMYGREWKTYREIPYTHRAIRKNYTDTADTGNDFLCSIDYVDTEQGNYITNVIYNDASMETTEVEVSRMMMQDNTQVANIESNNGGRGFARNVERMMREAGNGGTVINWFHQSANKETRILTRANEVQNLTYFPEGWRNRWPKFAAALDGHRRAGRNAHDDAADALTGTVEKRGETEYQGYKELPNADNGCNVLVEIHPMINGKFIYCRANICGGCVFIDKAYIGEARELTSEELTGEVQIEAPATMRYYVQEMRKRCSLWARQERGNKLGYMDANRQAVKGFKFREVEDMAGFMRNLSDYDGRDVYEAMYVLCCIVERVRSVNK